jgi:aspartyl-tRNA(Asn)/glutamyl-tRNA(Gln) amidotransferase subunit A
MRVRRVARDAIFKLFADVDLLVAPSRLTVAPNINEPLDQHPDRTVPKDAGLTALIPAGNLAGMPALSLPCGFAGDLPLGIQLVGLPFSENTLLAVGRELQGRTDWHKRKPPGVG